MVGKFDLGERHSQSGGSHAQRNQPGNRDAEQPESAKAFAASAR